jgi:hypothetical protein
MAQAQSELLRSTAMKFGFTLFAFALISAVPATAQNQYVQRSQVQVEAQPDRWCWYENLDHGSIQVCAAYTYEQCMASRSPGNTICFLNPLYDQRHRR